ncbi:MAG: NUDIX domain-containing protein [Candidatus Diapherotrites archaeon]|nr:NUDIX domain-containing protein [Candidatus Diapherotrites archaeon]
MYPESSSDRLGGAHSRTFGDSPDIGSSRMIVGLVVFDGEKFLLLHRVLHWRGWEFPKGGVKDNEEVFDAIGRELFEETGIPKYELVGKVDEIHYFDSVRKIKSFVQNFIVRVSSNNKISFEHQDLKDGVKVVEHDDFKWCFPSEAVKMLKHKNMKNTMIKAVRKLGLEYKK